MKDRTSSVMFRRCLITKNECGTDTWKEGWTCPCLQCRAYLAERRFSSEPEKAKRAWLDAIPDILKPTPRTDDD